MSQDAYGAYYRHVELHWSLKRDRQIIVSPLEFQAIQSWYEADVPLAVVLEAINVFIERKQKAKRQRGFLLTHVDGTVTKMHETWKTLHEGAGEEEGDLLVSKLKDLQRRLKRLAKAFPEETETLETLSTDLAAIRPDAIVTFEALDSEVEVLDERLVAHFTAKLSEDEQRELRADIEDLLTEEEDPEFFGKMLRDAVRVHYELPRLTLLG